MLTQEQIDKLNKELGRCDLPRNPLVRLIVASEYATLALDQVLEHLIVQLLRSNADNLSLPIDQPARSRTEQNR